MDFTLKLHALARELKANFTLNGKPVPYENVFSATGLLPGLAKRANQLSALCLGYGIGASFEETEGTTLGTRVKFDETTPDLLRLFCIYDVLCELIQAGPTRSSTPLDELLYD